MLYKRKICIELIKRLQETRKFIQIITGPRQTGKTTGIKIALNEISIHSLYVTCDDPGIHDRIWLEQMWEQARQKLIQNKEYLLVIDEIQKIPNWPEIVKRFWEEDTIQNRNLKVVLLGSSTLLIQKGLTESLKGRFEILRNTHWSFNEMNAAFGWNIDTYILFGGYPGAASLIQEPERWRRYVMDSLIEPTISKDVFQMQTINKPALLRNLFSLGCIYSGQIISYQKLLGQLHDAGNTTTLSHYLKLLEKAGLLMGLEKYTFTPIRKRGSSPKLLALNTALITAQSIINSDIKNNDPVKWGRLLESAAGAHLCNNLESMPVEVTYWREGNYEVDFILSSHNTIICIEIKSGTRRRSLPGIEKFEKKYGNVRKLLVGGDGIKYQDFFSTPPVDLLS